MLLHQLMITGKKYNIQIITRETLQLMLHAINQGVIPSIQHPSIMQSIQVTESLPTDELHNPLESRVYCQCED